MKVLGMSFVVALVVVFGFGTVAHADGWTSDTGKVYLTTGADSVGIGDDTPDAKLDVAGDLNVDEAYLIDGTIVLSTADAETGGTDNTFVGEVAGGTSNTGANNTFVGEKAGFSNTSGANNTFLGRRAGYTNTTGDANTFIGLNAGFSNTTGNYNTFAGVNTGYYNTTGVDNTFLGRYSGYGNTTGIQNTFLGRSAGSSNSTGGNNTFVGRNTGCTNTTGGDNTFIGLHAGYYNTTGARNTFAGLNAGRSNTTGTDNAFVARYAGYNNTTGVYNSFLGEQAGFTNTTGNNNTFVGRRAGYSNSTGGSNVFLGYAAGENETGSNKLYISNSDSAYPLIYGEFDNNLLRVNGTIQTKEIEVTLSGWSDHILKPDHKLMSLEDTEKHISENGHLPGIPSEKELKKSGLNLAEMAKLQMAKIEELTLHLIKIQRTNHEVNGKLEARIAELEQKLKN